MDVLSTDALLSAVAAKPDVPTEAVDCPELGGAVLVRAIPGTIRNRLEAGFAAIAEGADGSCMDSVLVALVAACVVDEKGHTVLTKAMAEKVFKNYPSVAFRVRDKAVSLADMSAEDKKALTESFD